MSYNFLRKPVSKVAVQPQKKEMKMTGLIKRLLAQINAPIFGGKRHDPVTNTVVELHPPSHSTVEIISSAFREAIDNRAMYIDAQGNIKVDALAKLVEQLFDLYIQTTAQVILYKETKVVPELLRQIQEEEKEQKEQTPNQ